MEIMNMKDMRIVIPAYNEEKGIVQVVERVKKACPEAELVVVNDCSIDNTAQLAQKAGAIVFSNSVNMGKGGATKAGFLYNLTDNIKYLAFIDADNTYPPESFSEIYRLCKEKNNMMVIGSRFLGAKSKMPFNRKIGNQIFSGLLSFYSKRKTTDTSTGQRVINRQLLAEMDRFPNGLDFDTAMTTFVLFEGMAYAEVPIDYFERKGSSKLSSIKDGYRFLRVIMNAARHYRPVVFYCTLGIPYLILKKIVELFPS